MATSDLDGNCDVSPKGDPPGQLVHVIDDTTIALAERPGNKRADGYKNILANPHVGLNFLIPGRGDTLRINGRARLVSDAPFFDEMVVKGHRPLLAVVVEIDDIFFHCAKAFLRSGIWKPETWDPEATVPRRSVIASEVEPAGMSIAQLDEYYDESSYSRASTSVSYPFLKGHGTENDFVLLPDLDGSVHGDLSRRAGACAVRPAGGHRRRRRAAGIRTAAYDAVQTRQSGSWTTATPTGRSRRCAATASACSCATWSTRASRTGRGRSGSTPATA